MAFLTILTILFGTFAVQTPLVFSEENATCNNFYAYYKYLWGFNHFSVNPQGTKVQLLLDRSSGAGFRSKLDYGYGLFHIKMKIPNKKTRGIVPNFYLTSAPDYQDPGNHFEIDFEFLGTTGRVQTNVNDSDSGHREKKFKLWFDPSKHYHAYEFLWNPYQIVLFVDKIPIRVFKNNKGIAYPTKAMHIEASIWNAEFGGEVNWKNTPFITYYSDFGFSACSAPAGSSNLSACASDSYFWNTAPYRQLSPAQKQQMAYYRRKYMDYDYCAQESTRKPECALNN